MRVAVFSIFILLTTTVRAQFVRLHLGGGFSNYIGDIQQRRLSFDQIRPMFSAGIAYEINDAMSLRFDYSQGGVAGDDKKGKATRVIRRNLSFQSSIREFCLLGEYNWNNNFSGALVPYFFAGVGVFSFNPYTYDTLGRMIYLPPLSTEGQGLSKYPTRKPYKLTQFNIPFGGGIKFDISDNIFLGFEGGIRKLFTDYLDDVSAGYVSADELLRERGPVAVAMAFRGNEIPPGTQAYPKEGTQRGSKDKDWYYFAQFRISFRIKSGDEGYNGRRNARRQLGCPSWF